MCIATGTDALACVSLSAHLRHTIEANTCQEGPPPKTKHLNPPPTSFLFNMIVSERGDFQCTKHLHLITRLNLMTSKLTLSGIVWMQWTKKNSSLLKQTGWFYFFYLFIYLLFCFN
jgi:hypothetical protein